MGEFRRIKRELAYQGTIMKIYKDYVEVNGKKAVWDFFHHNGGAAVIPVTREGKILMVRQYRNAIDRFTLEIPAGAFDTTNESGVSCVARELEEETGYKAGSVEWLITIRSMVAFCNEKVEIFVPVTDWFRDAILWIVSIKHIPVAENFRNVKLNCANVLQN